MQTYRSLPAVVCFLFLAGCHSTADRTERNRTASENELFVVGKVELVPPLRADEQDLRTGGSGRLKNRVYVFFSDRFVDIQNLGLGAGKHAALVDLNKPFTVKRRGGAATHYSGGMVWMQSTATYSGYMNSRSSIQTGHLYLQSNYTYDIAPTDKAVYVGTWRYHRNEFNQIKKVEYIDEYAQGLREYRQFVGDPNAPLRKISPRKANP